MTTPEQFQNKYPHGVLTQQEGGIPNDADNYREAIHVCRKHRRRETVCKDAQAAIDAMIDAAYTVPQFMKEMATERMPKVRTKRRQAVAWIVFSAVMAAQNVAAIVLLLTTDYDPGPLSSWSQGASAVITAVILYMGIDSYRMTGKVIRHLQRDIDAPLYEYRRT